VPGGPPVAAPGPVDTRPLLATKGAGKGLCLAEGLVEDRDVSFVPASFWEEVGAKRRAGDRNARLCGSD
jgi:hypothetical protein